MKRKWLIKLRTEAGFTQKQLAEIVGISHNYLCEIELGYKNPSGQVANRIASVLLFDMALFYTQNGRVKRTKNAANREAI
ncbi:helix-turn-helix domain-containing protein [Paludifilum halophilum]|uniref:HTH cro/C1-type domain-containing protein n=1 Tax=Paludifilum halophilum TaxID=1642702 RepID=A0A235B7R5_9BACL|nr:helix-turn-helix transcriptional regulator [Paludifilum halophilum]OYD07897.1 hypothetical protein CHM34_07160 [Paludifilum halophilum]